MPIFSKQIIITWIHALDSCVGFKNNILIENLVKDIHYIYNVKDIKQ